MGSNPTFSAKIKTIHPDGLYFLPKVGFERRLLETCQWHVSTAVAARRPTTSKIFNGCLPQQMESHRPDLSARSIRRERRLLAECRWHSATAVGARRPTTSKIFNGCSPQRKESHRPDLGARSIRRDGRLLVECIGCLRNISAKKISADRRNFSKGGSFSCRQKPKKKRGKVSIFACFDNNFQRLKISQIFSQILLTKGDTPAIIYFVAERQAVHRERSMRVCWNW